jgi:hypothetical protein
MHLALPLLAASQFSLMPVKAQFSMCFYVNTIRDDKIFNKKQANIKKKKQKEALHASGSQNK